MTVGPFPVAPVIARLKAQVPKLKLISQAADLRTAVDQQPRAVPAAYVVRQERARPSAGASGGVLVQEMNVDVVVVLYVRNHASQDTGEAAAAEMDALIAECRGALLNWRPAIEFDPLSQTASRDDTYRAAQLSAQEIYRSRYRIEVRP